MMTILRLFIEFFFTGLLAVGGGLATLPFLYDIGEKTGWFTEADVLNMIAVSESTPGPIGVNMATFTGFITGDNMGSFTELVGPTVAGIFGSLTATLGLVLPSYIVIVIIAKFLDKYKSSPLTEGTFSLLRPASTAMVTAAGLSVASLAFFPNGFDLNSIGAFFGALDYKVLILTAVILVGTILWKKGHPIVFIAFGAVCGIIFKM